MVILEYLKKVLTAIAGLLTDGKWLKGCRKHGVDGYFN